MFISYDKDGNKIKHTHEIDHKEGLSRCGFTLDPPGDSTEKPASKKDIKAVKKLIKDNGDDIDVIMAEFNIENIDALTKVDISNIEQFIAGK